MKPMTRANRRNALARMKAKARRLMPDNPKAERYADHLAACSCMGCGHQRYWFGPTIQERRAFARERI
jgi:hypothetical protein